MTVGSDDNTPIPRKRRYGLMALLAIAGLVAATAGVYGIAGFGRNPADPDCATALRTAQRLAPLARADCHS
jgi:hypothetical protein